MTYVLLLVVGLVGVEKPSVRAYPVESLERCEMLAHEFMTTKPPEGVDMAFRAAACREQSGSGSGA